jgi:pre-mRNA-splicing factor 18
MKPLFKLLKKKKADESILLHVSNIADFAEEREYVKANDSYMRLSIGNAPWPLGVTGVGIHARSAMERIASSHIARKPRFICSVAKSTRRFE